jgi:hypothetical protein
MSEFHDYSDRSLLSYLSNSNIATASIIIVPIFWYPDQEASILVKDAAVRGNVVFSYGQLLGVGKPHVAYMFSGMVSTVYKDPFSFQPHGQRKVNLTWIKTPIVVFWAMTPCSYLVDRCQHFRGT